MADLVIAGVTLIDGTGAPPQRVDAVAVDADRIISVGDVPSHRGRTLDASGRYLMPGLVNMHDHLIYRNVLGHPSHVSHRRPAEVAILALRNSFDALRNGWTTTVDMASAFEIAQVIRDLIERGDLVGPRIVATGNPICVSAGHASDSNTCLIADGPSECRKAARLNLGRGADMLKIMASHDPYDRGGTEWTRPEMTRDEIDAVFDQARRWGKKTAAHVMGKDAIHDVVEAGVDILHHGTYLDEATAKMMAARGTYFCPTLSAYARRTMDPVFRRGSHWADQHGHLVEPILEAARVAIAAGVPLVVGTDSTGLFSEDVALLRDCGLEPMASLQAATINGARALGIDHLVGSIEVGKRADLVLLESDPYEDAQALDDVWRVVKDGRVLDPLRLQLEAETSKTWLHHADSKTREEVE